MLRGSLCIWTKSNLFRSIKDQTHISNSLACQIVFNVLWTDLECSSFKSPHYPQACTIYLLNMEGLVCKSTNSWLKVVFSERATLLSLHLWTSVSAESEESNGIKWALEWSSRQTVSWILSSAHDFLRCFHWWLTSMCVQGNVVARAVIEFCDDGPPVSFSTAYCWPIALYPTYIKSSYLILKSTKFSSWRFCTLKCCTSPFLKPSFTSRKHTHNH